MNVRSACVCLAAALLAACPAAPPAGFAGYVEADYVRVGSPLAGTLARRAGQPFTEQRQIQPLNSQRLRSTGGAGQGADVGGIQALGTNARHGPRAGLEGEGGEFDVDGGHTGLDR